MADWPAMTKRPIFRTDYAEAISTAGQQEVVPDPLDSDPDVIAFREIAKRMKRQKNRSGFSKARAEAWKRDGGLCVHCGASGSEVHHIKQFSKGGGHELENLVTLCWLCHRVEHGGPNSKYAAERDALRA